MGRYRKLDPRFWADVKVRGLSDDGKLAFLFVLSHPHMTSLGAMRASLSGLAAELGWPARRFEQALRPAIETGMVEANTGASYLGLPNFLRYNEPEGPNSVAGAWLSALDLIPECPERVKLIGRCLRYLEGRSEKFRAAIPPGVWTAFAPASASGMGTVDPSRMDTPHPCPIPEPEPEPEPEQEQEPELEQEHRPGATAPASESAGTPPLVSSNGDGPEPRRGRHRPRHPSPPGSATPPGFAEFWGAYPKRVARDDALKAWRKLDPDAALQATILADVGKRLESDEWRRENGRFIPYPATYLNARRWKDEGVSIASRAGINAMWQGQAAGEIHL